jgi:hypothetical protein
MLSVQYVARQLIDELNVRNCQRVNGKRSVGRKSSRVRPRSDLFCAPVPGSFTRANVTYSPVAPKYTGSFQIGFSARDAITRGDEPCTCDPSTPVVVFVLRNSVRSNVPLIVVPAQLPPIFTPNRRVEFVA